MLLLDPANRKWIFSLSQGAANEYYCKMNLKSFGELKRDAPFSISTYLPAFSSLPPCLSLLDLRTNNTYTSLTQIISGTVTWDIEMNKYILCTRCHNNLKCHLNLFTIFNDWTVLQLWGIFYHWSFNGWITNTWLSGMLFFFSVMHLNASLKAQRVGSDI